jgi:hypothetical protein
MRLLKELTEGFPVPGGFHPWGTGLDRFGPVPDSRWRALPGSVELRGHLLGDVQLNACVAGPVVQAIYTVRDEPRLLAEALGDTRFTERPEAAGKSHAVVRTWELTLGDGVTATLAESGAPRGDDRAGLYVQCSEERLARPFLDSTPAAWHAPGTVVPLGEALDYHPKTPARIALYTPELRPARAWMESGLWESADHWGITDGSVTAVFSAAARPTVRLVRLLPARGSGCAWIEASGGTVLRSTRHDGLEEVRVALEARGVEVQVHEEPDV